MQTMDSSTRDKLMPPDIRAEVAAEFRGYAQEITLDTRPERGPLEGQDGKGEDDGERTGRGDATNHTAYRPDPSDEFGQRAYGRGEETAEQRTLQQAEETTQQWNLQGQQTHLHQQNDTAGAFLAGAMLASAEREARDNAQPPQESQQQEIQSRSIDDYAATRGERLNYASLQQDAPEPSPEPTQQSEQEQNAQDKLMPPDIRAEVAAEKDGVVRDWQRGSEESTKLDQLMPPDIRTEVASERAGMNRDRSMSLGL